jgi:hypothetical protein
LNFGTGSDAFFAALAVAQTLSGLLYAPYEGFAQRFALDRLRDGGAPAAPLVASYLVVSGTVLVPYYLWGEGLLGPLFGRAYTADPALWRHHFLVLGALVPLAGAVTTLQVCCQVRERYELPKVGLVVSRLLAIGLYLAAGDGRMRAISVVVVAAHVVAVAIGAWGAGPWRAPRARLARDTRAALREWLSVNRWTMILKTDQLLERVLAARVKSGFLSLFSLGWSAVVSVVEAFHAAFAVLDSNRYHATTAGVAERGAVGGLRAILWGPYRRSTTAALWLAAMGAVLAVVTALVVLATGWAPGGVRPAEIVLLLTTLVLATLVLSAWKQLSGAYTIQHRGVQFARGLTLVYLVFVGPRVLLTWQGAAVGFCAGLVAYYATQVAVLGRRA